jgi:hypothetical protein
MPEPTAEDIKRHVVNADKAREQASEGRYGFMRSEFRRAKPTPDHPEGELFEIPHKDLFDPDQQDRWDDLQDEMRSYEREPDIKSSTGVVIAKGPLIYPHRKDGQRVRPSWPERLGIVLWGKDGAKRAKTGGINFNEIEVVWAKQKFEMEERLEADPKSPGSGPRLAAVPDGD